MDGTYGTTKPANISNDDVQILYCHKPNRTYTGNNTFHELSVDNLLRCQLNNENISGLYNLKLPLDIFGQKGIYTIYIKPKEISIPIYHVGYLQNFDDIKGVIFDSNNGLKNYTSANALAGYRIEYDGYSRIITSSNLCRIVPSEGGDKYQLLSTSGYETGMGNTNLLFCTVTPSSPHSATPNYIPPIGNRGETVKIVNTKFNPLMFEVEILEHDIETLSYMLEGEQVRNLENGTFTIYNHNKEIYKQYDTYTVKTQLGRPLYDIKANKNIIDSGDAYVNTIGLE